MSWISALQEYNSKTGAKFMVPKKDTPEYEEVKKIQASKATAPVTTIKKVVPAEATAPKGRGRPKKVKVPDADPVAPVEKPVVPVVEAKPVAKPTTKPATKPVPTPPWPAEKRRVIKRTVTEEYYDE